ncbi:SURF1 family protein [Ruania halotolerans]|uniref:SURF1 family protein n=1 Tax=Ruania halotolerans TaxID=2897773 RepID=UPI001E5C0A5A|nr:SURF1 family protein [Ruania halotolerans]UFU05668.1 SURF1 family protein [Ruania halotolerans]
MGTGGRAAEQSARSRSGAADWLRAATRPRLLGILLILLLGALLCIRLGAWQLDRAQIRGVQASEVAQSERSDGPALALAEVMEQGSGLTQEQLGQRVAVSGRYEPDMQFVVTGRGYDGEPGVYVLSALRVSGGTEDGALLPVVRGWVPETSDDVLAVPEGEVQVTGFLAGPEPAERGIDPTAGTGAEVEVEVISPAQLVNHWGGPMYSAYLRLATEEPVAGTSAGEPVLTPTPIGPPEITGGGLNVRNLAYAAEWWIFGGFAIVLWWRMVRDEVRHLREERDAVST